MSYILILGAKSDIAKATANVYSFKGYDLYLAARNVKELTDFCADLKVRSGRNVNLLEFDVTDFESHKSFYADLKEKPKGVISFIGYLGKQEVSAKDFSQANEVMQVNFSGLVSVLNLIADDFEQKKSGFIVGVSSVAGDRGRQSNYIYGASKAAFTAYLSGLRNRLFSSGVHVLTVKPGFVATSMTAGMDLPEKLTAQPEEVAEDIFSAQYKKKDIIYSKWFWRYIMLIICSIPESIFKKMGL